MPSEKHVAVCNFPLSSHPRTVAKLVCKLAATAPNVRFSFLSTAKSNDSVFPPPSRAALLPSNLGVYDVGDGLPAGYDKVASNPRVEADLFFRAAPVNFLAGVEIAERDAGSKVSLLLSDGLVSLVACELAEKMHVPWVAFWTGAPYALSVHVHADLILQLRQNAANEEKTLDMIPGLSVMRMTDLPDELVKAQDMSMISRMFRELGNVIPRAAAVVMNSFAEMYPEPLTAGLKSKFNILLYLGLRPSPPALDKTGCLTWLDSQGPQTVVYISFGSGTLTNLTPDEIMALAEALESTRTPFLWSLNDQLKARCLPVGFEERTSAHGRIVPWAPQTEVLSHPACGAFVMQCGHNSVFESIAGGVPMICRPVAADQMLTARSVEEVWGIGIGVEGRVVTKSGMVKALEVVLRSEEGKEMRKKVGEFRKRLLVAAGPEGRAEADFKTLVELISTL
ncbi:anthocyanidin 3-O-glucosyltransferase 7-like [Syzygium oleosum]|uniref:anthocyanidin 3-O-glucosyltransferase 7-like n=1 Tax=Syzygium oleosum TaxID=219896 RepID=UPI0011D1EF1E|nr:anthocyanidin 3-O-glucosyltransferase 7-like [Syzygium oleosum]